MENLSTQRFTDSEKGKVDTPETSDNKYEDGSKKCPVIVLANAAVCPAMIQDF